jgi:hypothetical protein
MCVLVEQINITFFFGLVVCNGKGTKLCFKLDLNFNSLWKWSKLKKFKNPKNRFQNSIEKGGG